MKIIDTRGQACPAPLILTRRALKEAGKEESVKVLTDSTTSLSNISRYLNDNGISFSIVEKNGIHEISISNSSVPSELPETGDYCTPEIPHFTKGNFVVAFSSDLMGKGDDSLGSLLMLNFIKSLKDLDSLPLKLLFYNSGVKLGISGTETSVHLTELQSMGVTLLFCATCINHYKLNDEIKLGTLSNMFEIAQVMASAQKVLKP